MSSSRDRALSIVELLAQHLEGLPLSVIADRLEIPRSATHRLLNDLKDTHYIRQDHDGGNFSLTVKLVSLSLNYLSAANFNNLVRPVLERLAQRAGDLVMLSVVEGDRLMRVAKAQGARVGLQYNPVEEPELYLAGSANGQAWLAALSDDAGLHLLARQGIRLHGYGPSAPRTINEAMDRVRMARTRGYVIGQDSHELGISAIATAICRAGREPIGTLSIAGPSQRLSAAWLAELAPDLITAAAELAVTAEQTALFRMPQSTPANTAANTAGAWQTAAE
jgi:IclR family transcriptional regulator, acetate operon repressor